MNRSKARNLIFGLITLLAMGIALMCTATADETTGWVIVGPDTFGGNYIVNGTTNVGQLGPNTFPSTSANGGDYVTLQVGGTATGYCGATIEFTQPNNIFVNNGTVYGASRDRTSNPFADTAVAYYSGTGISNQLLDNTGNIYGGCGMATGCFEVSDSAVAFYSFNGISDIAIYNSGGIYGGNYSTCTSGSNPPVALGDGIVMYDAGEALDISNVLIYNSNTIAGGSDVKGAYVLGTGIGLVSLGNVSDIEIGNVATGIITGGNNNSGGFINGSALVLMASPSGTGSVSDIVVGNAGQIIGGNGANNEDLTRSEGSMVGNVAGSGLVIYAANGVSGIAIDNTGLIAGGNCAYGGEGECYFGSVAGSGIGIFDNSGYGEDICPVLEADINGVLLDNSGEIKGGNESEDAYIVGSGVGIVGFGNILNVSITNTSTGVITGGNNNYGGDDEYYGAVVGSGLGIVAGAQEDDNSSVVNHVLIGNNGVILGGNCNEEGVVVGSGIGIAAADGVYGVTIGNSGIIAGGNNNEYGTIVGTGIGIYDDSDERKDIDGVTIYNSGLITGGTGNRAYGTMAGVGVGIVGEGNVTNILVDNVGTIAGGNGNNDADFTGEGLLIASYDGNVSNVTINNLGGAITGGNGVGMEAGANGIDIEAEQISNLHINNYGYIAGGNGGAGCGYGYCGGDGIYVDAERCDPDFNLYNAGLIVGGNGGIGTEGGGMGGAGVYLDLGMGIDATINNYGSIYGGNAGPGGTAGEGIQTYGNNIAINNYGFISAGSGAVEEGLPAGYPAVAISVDGTGNSVSLWNHSSVHGTIQGLSSGANYLNLDFSGVSSTAKAALAAQLESPSQPVPWQGNGTNFAGTFTFRGVQYYVDPLILNLTTSSYQGQGITINQQAIGANLNSLPVNPTGVLLALYNAIDFSGDVPAALEALNPERYQIYGDIAQADATFMALSIDERLNNLRDGSETIDTTGIGGGSTETTTAGYDKDGKTVVVPDQKSVERRWGFFAEGSGIFTNIQGRGGDLSNAGFTSSGLMLGVDGKVGENWVTGLLFDYTATTANLDNLNSTADVQSLSGGAYAGYHNGGWYANGLAAYGSNTYNATRDIIFPGFSSFAFSNTDGNQEEVNVDGGYDFHLNDKVTVGPLVGLQYVNLNVDGFNEVGGGAADLAVGSQQVNSLRSRLGFRANYHTQIAKEVAFATDLHASWQHEFLDNSYLIGSDFIGSGLSPFGVETTSPQRESALMGVSANFTIRDRMTLFFDYDVQAGQQSYLEQSVKGGLKFSF